MTGLSASAGASSGELELEDELDDEEDDDEDSGSPGNSKFFFAGPGGKLESTGVPSGVDGAGLPLAGGSAGASPGNGNFSATGAGLSPAGASPGNGNFSVVEGGGEGGGVHGSFFVGTHGAVVSGGGGGLYGGYCALARAGRNAMPTRASPQIRRVEFVIVSTIVRLDARQPALV
jgi:hypothetical protein